jgi:hypothetical protein
MLDWLGWGLIIVGGVLIYRWWKVDWAAQLTDDMMGPMLNQIREEYLPGSTARGKRRKSIGRFFLGLLLAALGIFLLAKR